MTRPTPRAINAALTALEHESALWTTQRERLQRVANMADGLLIEPGFSSILLDEFLAAYNQVARRYTDLCTSGRDAAAAISGTLAAVAATYASEEARNLHAQYHLY
jgi:hypothetical protein